jgi:molybdate transport system permease protein
MTLPDLGPIALSLKLAAVSTAMLLFIGVPLAYALSRAPAVWRIPLHTLISLPLVLPPSVLGFYLLVAFSPEHAPGRFLAGSFGFSLAFSFPGLVIGSVAFSLPFMVNPMAAGFAALPASLAEASYVLGHSRLRTAWSVLLPNARPALLAGAVLAFAHTLGEFGVALLIGGKIPGITRVASIALFDEVESLRFGPAHAYAAILLALGASLLAALYALDRRGARTY